MSILDRLFKRNARAPSDAELRAESSKVYSGRVSKVGGERTVSPYRSRQTRLLTTLRQTHNAVDAIELLIEETGDISQALYNFMRLANVGHEMAIYKPGTEERMPEVEKEWREFAARVNELSNAGLDGLLDQFHYLAFVKGAQGCEVEVAKTLDDIVDVYPLDPQTIIWELEERRGRQRWIPYQDQWGPKGKVSLERANFFWVPTDPKVDDPSGRLLLKPTLAAIDFQIQILNDLQKVIHNQGWPRYDISIVTDRLMQICPPDVKADQKKFAEWVQEHIDWLQNLYRELKPDDSFIHLDSVTVNMEQGGNATRSLDVRAVMEMLDTQMLTASKQVNVMMGRVNSSTESWGSIQFRIFVSGIQSIQRGSKRLVESICALWLRVKGIQGVPHFTHNLIDYESEKQRQQIQQMRAEFLQLAVNMGWITNDAAANELFGHDAVGEPRGGELDGRTQEANRDGADDE